MYVLQGNFKESPQKTHIWNRSNISHRALQTIQSDMCVAGQDSDASTVAWAGLLPVFHMPIFGGWSTFIVIQPQQASIKRWYIGWVTQDATQISRIPLSTPVRVLLSREVVTFFGVDETGNQIPVIKVFKGSIGNAGKYSRIPLL
jgi:hypothetical protein